MTDHEPLEDQRDFLLRSLADLEREHEAGDVDDLDYAALKDDYTARAARVLRALEAGQAAPSSRRRLSRRFLVSAAGVVAVAVLAGVLVAQAAGRRDPGETVTGDVRLSVTEKLNQAQRRSAERDFEGAIELYDEVLDADPENVEALAYRTWIAYRLDGDPRIAVAPLVDATTIEPRYPDAHAFLAVVLADLGFYEEADLALDQLERLNPREEIRGLMAPVRERVDAALAAIATSSSVAP